MRELYHVLNRGVDKRKIYMDNRDYYRFIHDLFEFNDVLNVDSNNTRIFESKHKKQDVGRPVIRGKGVKTSRKLIVTLHAFCLMPNHYHLLISPLVKDGVSLFMKKLNGGYAKYFNERYERNGALFQGKYKSVEVKSDRHFSYILHYIHFNPLDLVDLGWRKQHIVNYQEAIHFLNSYRWSSHLDYCGKKNFPSLTQRGFMLDYIAGERGYAKKYVSLLHGFAVDELEDFILE